MVNKSRKGMFTGKLIFCELNVIWGGLQIWHRMTFAFNNRDTGSQRSRVSVGLIK